VIGLLIIASRLVGGAYLRSPALVSLLVSVVVLIVATPVIILLTRGARQTIAAALVLVIWFAVAFFAFLGIRDVELGIILSLTGIALSALLIGEVTVNYAAGLSIIGVFAALYLSTGTPSLSIFQSFIPFAILIIVPTGIIHGLAHSLPEVTGRLIEERDAYRLKRIETSSVLVQRLMATRLNLDTLLKETVTLVRETYAEASDVQLFLTDAERRNVSLVTSTRADAQIGQQVGIGSLSVIGRVTITGQTIVVHDTSEDRPYRRTALLPGIRTELALPLRVGQEIIGVLDVLSGKEGAFGSEEIASLENVVAQISITIDNARLYGEAQAKAEENKRLFEQARTNLREIERLNQQLTGNAWAEYLRSQTAAPAYTLDLVSGRVENAAEWTPTLTDAARRNQISVRQTPQSKIVALPISVRGQAIGAMEFELAPDQDVSPEQMAVLQQVMERLGLAAENTRLFEEAQRLAQREALVNEISTRLQGTTNVEGVIAAATQSLADAFHAPRVAIRLGTPGGTGSGL